VTQTFTPITKWHLQTGAQSDTNNMNGKNSSWAGQ